MQTSFSEKRQTIPSASLVESRHTITSQVQTPQSNVSSYNLGHHLGAGTAIAAAASQAIAATQQVNIFKYIDKCRDQSFVFFFLCPVHSFRRAC